MTEWIPQLGRIDDVSKKVCIYVYLGQSQFGAYAYFRCCELLWKHNNKLCIFATKFCKWTEKSNARLHATECDYAYFLFCFFFLQVLTQLECKIKKFAKQHKKHICGLSTTQNLSRISHFYTNIKQLHFKPISKLTNIHSLILGIHFNIIWTKILKLSDQI